ncbi:MAG: L-threonylcarbamoyladenylate synthase [Eggerthellaceae bacterium]
MPPLSSSKREAVAALKRGEAVIFPTETVYGLGVSVEAAASPEALYDLKERDRGKPVSWLVGGVTTSTATERTCPTWPGVARAYWPGPLTLIVEASGRARGLPLGGGLHRPRMPDNDTALSSSRRSAARWPPRPRTSRVCKRRGLRRARSCLAACVGVVVPDDTDDESGVASASSTHRKPPAFCWRRHRSRCPRGG